MATKKTSQQTKDRVTEDGVESQNHFILVPTLDIQIVERPEPGKETEKLFFNPRSPESFTPDEMQSLMESLAEDGLQQPPIVRIFTGDGTKDGPVKRIELVAGERRLRSIQRLIDANTPCKTDDGETVPAKVAFAKIPCRVYYNMSDEKALRIAFIENWQHQQLSVKDEIDLVQRLLARKLKQEEIATMLGTNVTWVSQTSNFKKELPATAFERLLENRLSRHVAVKMLGFRPEDREPLFKEMVKVEEEESAAAEANLKAERERAEDDEDLATRGEEKAISDRNPGEAKRQARRRGQAQKKQQEVDQKLEKLRSEKGTLRQGTLQTASQRAGIAPKKAQVLTKGMIEQFYVDLIGKWLENGKIDSVTKNELPAEMLEIMQATARAILTGNHDPSKVVRNLMVARGAWTLPDGYNEEPEELLEVTEGDQEID